MFRRAAALACALVLALSLVPAAGAASGPQYQIGQIVGGDPNCNHKIKNLSEYQRTVRATCTEYGYGFWPCEFCDAEEVCAVLSPRHPSGHEFVYGRCRYCEAKDPNYQTPAANPGTATNPGTTTDSGTTTTPDTPTNPGTTTTPDTTPNPDTPQTCDHANQPSSGWTYETVKATCAKEGRSYRICKVCGYEETLSTAKKTDHTWEQKTVQATATAGGRTYRVCKVCGTEETLSTTEPVKPVDASHGSGSTDLPKLSQAEITQLLNSLPAESFDSMYEQQPSSSAPYAAGKIKASVLEATLARLNVMRRIAGLPAVSLDSSLTEQAQYGAVVVSTGPLTHTPAKPAGMDNSFYQTGYKAASSSNLASGYGLVRSIDGWMFDSDGSNIDRLGHRRWQLNPTMGKTGFGAARSTTVEWAFDRSGSGCDYNYIAWPSSGNFPNDLFGNSTAWSVTVNPNIYAVPSASDLTVTVTRKRDGTSWTLGKSNTYSPSSKLYFNVDTAGYGVSNCIIFRPDENGTYSGIYSVEIEGLRYKNGGAASLAYEVDFFSTNGSGGSAQQPTEPGNPFTDVPAGSYYHDAVLWALDKGVTTGVTATQFQPNSTCTRGQVVTFLWRAKGSPEPKTKTNPFTDVSSSSPFYKAILWAQENGITTGTTATTFNPGGTCTSGHVVTFLWRAEGEPQASGSSALANTYSGQYYTNAIAWADGGGLLTGVGGTFVPSQRSPRANIVTYLYRNLAQ